MTQAPQSAGEAAPSRIGRYRIDRLLGRGGYGSVYLAFDETLQRLVAIKVPHRPLLGRPLDVAMYVAEARVLASLDHPHVVPVYDAGATDDGLCYVVSKFIDGESLAARIRKEPLSLRAAAEVVAAIAEAAHHAHQHRVVHRDIKPANILLDRGGKPYLADFGLALTDEMFGRRSGGTGTAAYMSPEQASGEGHLVDGRSDVFSLGVVFYELLTRSRPFHGDNRREVIEQIRKLEVRPPRQIHDAIPKELERICLKALSKRAAERFTTALHMAEDLREFLVGEGAGESGTVLAATGMTARSRAVSPPDSSPAVRIVPKGLRSFDARDAEFFLGLLPGPRDRDGLPESVRFWKHRIEEPNPDTTFRVGLIYGPSGCGKSSLVKAGLLPRLASNIVTVYVEATADETESRLLRGLRRQCPELQSDLGLVDSVAAIRHGRGLAPGKRVLIVLDQFEQWLHAHLTRQDAELVAALRQCDGERTQCVVLVRDDFWMAVTRFMRELDAGLAEGHNSAAVDLFDLDHAHRVLAALGRAFGKLPEAADETSPEQAAFLQQAIAGLADNGKVICVRLALFAEMMKGKPWTPASWQAMGGTQGVGVVFLEETFCAATAPPEHRYHQRAVRDVLSALLPESGTQIKDRGRSYDDLRAASGYPADSGEFDELLRILDGELRLITPTDPAGSAEAGAHAAPDANGERRYQLTHDFLVPAVREWLLGKQKETWHGRAQLRLADQAARWAGSREARQLPSFVETAQILALTRRVRWTAPQREMMGEAIRAHAKRLMAAVALLVVLLVGGHILSGRIQAAFLARHVQGLWEQLRVAQVDQVPEVLEAMAVCRESWEGPLRHLMEAPDTEPNERFRAALALADDPEPLPPPVEEALWNELLQADSRTLGLIRDRLAAHQASLVPRLWRTATDEGQGRAARLRAASLLAQFDPHGEGWQRIRAAVGFALFAENPLEVDLWTELLRPVSASLVEPLRQAFDDISAKSWDRMTAARILVQYADSELLAELLLDAAPDQYAMLLPKALANKETLLPNVLHALPAAPPAAPPSMDLRSVERRRNAAVTLIHLGEPASVWPHLAASREPTLRTAVILQMHVFHVPPEPLLAGWHANRDPVIRQAILLALEPYRGPGLPKHLEQAVVELCLAALREGPQAERSAAQWLLSRWGRADLAEPIVQALAGQTGDDWLANREGHTLRILRAPVSFKFGSPESEIGREGHETQRSLTISRSFAIAVHEVTIEQFHRFRRDAGFAVDVSPSPRCPMNSVVYLDAIRYCRWLSERENIPEDQMCYPPLDRIARGLVLSEALLARSGYRLPTEAEWEYACRAGAETRWLCGNCEEHLQHFAWYALNSQDHLWPVGVLRPNALGMFDLPGNVAEWCHPAWPTPELYAGWPGSAKVLGDAPTGSLLHPQRGGGYQRTAKRVRSAQRFYHSATEGMSFVGFRIARTLPQ